MHICFFGGRLKDEGRGDMYICVCCICTYVCVARAYICYCVAGTRKVAEGKEVCAYVV